MSPIRRVVSLILALALTVAGGAGLAFLLLFAHWWKGWMVIGAGFCCALGVIWLYIDFIDATRSDGTR